MAKRESLRADKASERVFRIAGKIQPEPKALSVVQGADHFFEHRQAELMAAVEEAARGVLAPALGL